MTPKQAEWLRQADQQGRLPDASTTFAVTRACRNAGWCRDDRRTITAAGRRSVAEYDKAKVAAGNLEKDAPGKGIISAEVHASDPTDIEQEYPSSSKMCP
jgi:hypothetical protein